MNSRIVAAAAATIGLGLAGWLVFRWLDRKRDRPDRTSVDEPGEVEEVVSTASVTHCEVSEPSASESPGPGRALIDIVQEASEESFPASDSPPWTQGVLPSG